MALITLEELARGACIGVFGGAAGACTLVFPGSPIWLVPAAAAVGGCALTVPEVRQEVVRVMPMLASGAQRARAALPNVAWALPGVKAERRPQAATAQRDDTATARRSTAPAGALRPAQWLHAVNEQPDRAPHLLVTGPSGAGKTTFVSAALGKRPGRVVVVTPKVTPGSWAGAEVVTLDDSLSYEPLAQAFDALQTEAKRRSVALKRGERLEPLTVVLDELPELVAEIPAAGPFAVRLSRWGRELGMRQVVLATSDDALNVKGWAATRGNYVRVELDRPAEDGTRAAWLDDGQARRPLDLGNVQAGAERAQLRPWRGEERAPAGVATPQAAPQAPAALDLSDLLGDLLAAPVPGALESPRDGQAAAEVSLRPYVPTEGEGHRDTRSGTLVLPRDGGALHLHLHASAEAHAPAPAEAPARPAGAWRRKGPAVRRHKPAQAAQDRADELHRAYRDGGAAGRAYRALYRDLGGSKDTTLAAWQEGRAQRQKGD